MARIAADIGAVLAQPETRERLARLSAEPAGGILMAMLMPARAQDTAAGSVERGYRVFIHQMCHNCHGTVGQGGGVAGTKIAPRPFPWAAFAWQVRTPRQAMTPYSAKNLPDQDLADIYAYVVSIKPGPAAKDIPLLSGN